MPCDQRKIYNGCYHIPPVIHKRLFAPFVVVMQEYQGIPELRQPYLPTAACVERREPGKPRQP